jgi:hypothetical protein
MVCQGRQSRFGLQELIVVIFILALLAAATLRGLRAMGICLGVSTRAYDQIQGGDSKLHVQLIVGRKGQHDGNALRQLVSIRYEDICDTVPTESLAYCTHRWEWMSKSYDAMIKVYFLDGEAVYKSYTNYATTPPIVEWQDLRHRK